MTFGEAELQRSAEHEASDGDCWITSIKSTSTQSAERIIEILAGEKHAYAFARHAHGVRTLKTGDWICFYISKRGTVGHAKVVTRPREVAHGLIPNAERYPWLVALESVRLYVDRPLELNLEIRKALEAFKGREEVVNYGWFVRSTHRISRHDFHVLTR